MSIETHIAPDAAATMRAAIADARGREVFFIGHTDEHGRVVTVDTIARGTDGAVAAITHRAKYGDVAIHNHPGGPLDPSDADVTVSSIAAWSGVASFIVNNEVTEVYVLVEPMKPPTHEPLDPAAIAALITHDGRLASVLDNYEEREAQRAMLDEVVSAFNHGKLSVIEAGTGTGKTLA
jgi:ATP-dependent DNA helicase DinG